MVRLDDACAILWTMSVISWFTVIAISHFLLSSELKSKPFRVIIQNNFKSCILTSALTREIYFVMFTHPYFLFFDFTNWHCKIIDICI